MLTSQDVREGLGDRLRAFSCRPESAFNRVTVDSREVGPGDLFIALRGEKEDGHQFIRDAVARGATGVIGETAPPATEEIAWFQVDQSLAGLQELARHWRRKHPIPLTAVTGSVGKTTTKELMAAVLGKRGPVLKSPGNLNTEVGLPLAILGLEPHHWAGVVEMGMYGLGEIRALCQIATPQTGVVTNVESVHLSRLGSLERVAQAKRELLEALPQEGTAVLNGDDPLVKAMATSTTASVVWYGLDRDYQVWADQVQSFGLKGIGFRLHAQGGEADVCLSLPGRHHVYPTLAAAAVGLAHGLSLKDVSAALAQAQVEGRLTVVLGLRGSTILDDSYNASPASVVAALELLAEMPGRKIAVLGDMLELGSYDEEGHRRMARAAAHTADLLISLGERATLVAEEARKAGLKEAKTASSHAEVVAWLESHLRQGDYILVKGSRAMAMEQIVDGLRV